MSKYGGAKGTIPCMGSSIAQAFVFFRVSRGHSTLNSESRRGGKHWNLMKEDKCDVLVIGAGPAGSSAAREAAGMGADVLIVERKARVGLPVRCAEYIPAPLIGDLDLGRDFVVQEIGGMLTHLPGGECKEMKLPGYIVDRDRFDLALVQDAVQRGTRLMLGQRAVALEDGAVFVRDRNGTSCSVTPGTIIGADGPRSTVARWMGENQRDCIPGVQARVALTKPRSYTDVYFNPSWFAGYGWLFPKGKLANVGLAAKRRSGEKHPLKSLLMDFIERLAMEGILEGGPQSFLAGWIPVQPAETLVHGNMAIVGDAAGHAHPITGAGIFAAVTGGKMAGKAAACAARAGNLDLLRTYEADFLDLFGSTLERAVTKRRMLEEKWADLDGVIKSCWIAFREYYAT